jgi:hypothetical protein
VSHIFAQIVEGLHIHMHGLKPENELVTTTGLFSVPPIAPPDASKEKDVFVDC